jgi:hypothetical protein
MCNDIVLVREIFIPQVFRPSPLSACRHLEVWERDSQLVLA